ncbi:palmitoyltransferase ZDHHC3-like [Sycon ciliatum]|uniref:palmitoyltransferase ZDHHC3-like n=1 Tax=Sycon ciliatum TaxID=27933 RepID=UPI0020AC69BF|eukprot:scpid30381/ scgid14505/ Palmitoyltransferase ZDHHC3; GABA-A receptor-associated membrane protein 1; Golgi-specific DHHC zinc finger protein; Zinc finger DHHC domain-containing protein 3
MSIIRGIRRKGLFKYIFGLPQGPVWIICDPLGLFFAGVTHFLIGYGVFAVMTITILPNPTLVRWIEFAVFVVFAYLAVTSHLKAMLTNPGTVPLGEDDDVLREYCEMYETDDEVADGEENRRYCQRCEAPKPNRAHHCRTCRRCIRKADHHCIWVNNCVGENNMKFFVLFNFYIFVISVLALVYVVWHIIDCAKTDWGENCRYFSEVGTFLIMLFLFMEAVLFSMFCCTMGLSIISAIQWDETAIDRYKKRMAGGDATSIRKTEKKMTNFEAVFGRPRSLAWLSPLTVSRVGLYLQRKATLHTV